MSAVRSLMVILVLFLPACVSWEAPDADSDGFLVSEGDCDDLNPLVGPASEEIWYDGIDQDCDGNDADQDLDGVLSELVGGLDCWDNPNLVPEEYTVLASGGFSQPTAAEVSPKADEVWYDAVDQNCDDWSDFDQDGDTYDSAEHPDRDGEIGDDCVDNQEQVDALMASESWSYEGSITPEEINPGVSADDDACYDGLNLDCLSRDPADGNEYPEDYEADFDCDQDGFHEATDCDDLDALVFPDPSVDEVWYNGVDENCDNNDGDQDLDGHDSWVVGGEDCWDDPNEIREDFDAINGFTQLDAEAVNPDATETWYDGIDQDCAGDEDFDADEDGQNTDAYPDRDDATGTDCLDDDASSYLYATEFCDDVDHDCDGLVETDDDAVDATQYYFDADDDGYGTSTSKNYCQPVGEFRADNDDDCDDDDASEYPGATEYCDGDDDDCDDEVDEDDSADVVTWYRDWDDDGYGNETNTDIDCYQPAGYLPEPTPDGDEFNDYDCDDTDDSEFPGADEYCDGDDDDCDGDVDEDESLDVVTWYRDFDSDGYANQANTDIDCYQPTGYLPEPTPDGDEFNDYDCNDSESLDYPGADERCDGDDNDCDATVDEDGADDVVTWYRDADDDGFGDADDSDIDCEQPSGFVLDDTDCDDADTDINTDATEICDLADNDCDGDIDDDDDDTDYSGETTYYADTDDDGYGDLADGGTLYCAQPALTSTDNTDCDDGDSAINPSATEVCDGGVDNDCNEVADDADSGTDYSGETTYYVDGDGDGFGDETDSGVPFCESYSGYSDDPSDCDDGAYAVNPDATEVCDDIDNDCDDDIDDDDGSTDYTGEITYYVDDDGDGDGDSSDPGTEYCDQPASTSTNADDCNDAFAEINLAATEVCDGADNDCDDVTDEGYDSDSDGTPDCQDGEDCDGEDNDGDKLIDEGYDSDSDGTADCDDTEVCDGVDNDGDGLVDDDDDEALDEGGDPWGTAVDLSTATNWYVDDDEDGFGSSGAPPDLLCEAPAGTVADDSDCNDGDSAINPDATEVCDELDVDEDCDGDSDDADSNVDYTGETTYYIDFDEDTYGDSADEGAPACEQPLSTSVNALDCDDTESAINPDANEVCDSVDNDCDGDVDDDDANIDPATQSTYYVDADEDGDGSDADSGTLYCLVPSTHSDNQDDCDDSDAAINDDATEVCDNADNDCDGLIDDLDDDTDYTGETTYYADVDGDGDGATSDGGQAYCNEPSDSSTNADDCDDEDSGINEDATEICDSEDVDENCNGLADDLDGTTDYTGVSLYYPDSDGDTYGDEEDAGAAYCDPDSSLVVDATDCDDDETTVNPGGTEVCDGAADEDCDGDVDEDGAFDAQAWYADGDGDSYGDGDSSILSCEVPTGYVADATDCDDLDEDSFPGGIETCDGTADQDCDGDVDEDGASDASTWYADADGDSYGDSAVTSVACEVPSGYVSDATDCDDLDEDSYPGGTETCDGTADEDCDGDVDEDGASDASTWYADDDGDAFGDSSDSTAACDAPGGYVSDATDCDDGDDEENPGVTWYPDVDEDSYGDPDSTSNACERADEGDVTDNTDCDDGDATENPDVTWYVDVDGDGYGDAFNSSDCERSAKTDVTDATDCNDLDAGSNPDVDWYADSDGDLYGDPDVSTNCQPSLPSDVTDNTDCDDGEATVNPGETESATELDNDCDDMVDETFRSAGDLLITEVMANPEPTGSEPDNEFLENEFLEIYNTTSGTMDPGGVYVTTSCDSGSGFYLPKETLSIAAGDYAVLCFDDTTLGASCDYIYGTDGNDASSLGVTFSEDFCLTNDGATLDLDLNAANLDTVVYEGSDDWPSDKAGYSIMLVTGYYDETDNDDGLNWCHPADTEEYDTGNYGSPGSLGTCE